MTKQQYYDAMKIRRRIKDLKVIQDSIEMDGDETEIAGYKIPKNSKEVILALCKKEIDELEWEFDNL